MIFLVVWMWGAIAPIWSQSAMRAIRYDPEEIWDRDIVAGDSSQSAMRAIRYDLTMTDVTASTDNTTVAIRYACNKI